MTKKLLVILLSMILMISMVGCSSKDEDTGKIVENDVEESIEEEDISEPEISDLDEDLESVNWDKAIDETKEELMNPEYFDYVKDIHIDVNIEEEKITFTAVLDDSTTKDVAVDFADTIIRRFSSNVQMQNSSIKGPGHEYLGGVFDYYNIMIGVAPLSKTDNSNEWYVFDAISKGRHRNPKAK